MVHTTRSGSVKAVTRNARAAETDARATLGIEIVYYLRLKDGLIKIGTSKRALERLATHRRKLGADEVLAIEFGSHELERERHHQFAYDLAEAREIFHPSDALMAHIATLRSALNLSA